MFLPSLLVYTVVAFMFWLLKLSLTILYIAMHICYVQFDFMLKTTEWIETFERFLIFLLLRQREKNSSTLLVWRNSSAIERGDGVEMPVTENMISKLHNRPIQSMFIHWASIWLIKKNRGNVQPIEKLPACKDTAQVSTRRLYTLISRIDSALQHKQKRVIAVHKATCNIDVDQLYIFSNAWNSSNTSPLASKQKQHFSSDFI